MNVFHVMDMGHDTIYFHVSPLLRKHILADFCDTILFIIIIIESISTYGYIFNNKQDSITEVS